MVCNKRREVCYDTFVVFLWLLCLFNRSEVSGCFGRARDRDRKSGIRKVLPMDLLGTPTTGSSIMVFRDEDRFWSPLKGDSGEKGRGPTVPGPICSSIGRRTPLTDGGVPGGLISFPITKGVFGPRTGVCESSVNNRTDKVDDHMSSKRSKYHVKEIFFLFPTYFYVRI